MIHCMVEGCEGYDESEDSNCVLHDNIRRCFYAIIDDSDEEGG